MANRLKLQVRLFGSVLLAIGIFAVVIMVLGSWREATNYAKSKTFEVTAIAEVLAVALSEPVGRGDRVGALRAIRSVGRVPELEYASVIGVDGQVLAELGRSVSLVNRSVLKDYAPDVFKPLLGEVIKGGAAIVRGGVAVGEVKIRYRPENPWAGIVELIRDILLASIFAAFAAGVIALRYQRTIVTPLRHLSEAMAAAYREQDYDRTVRKESDDEIGEMVDIFNAFVSQIRLRDFHMARQNVVQEEALSEAGDKLSHLMETAKAECDRRAEFEHGFRDSLHSPLRSMGKFAVALEKTNLDEVQRKYVQGLKQVGNQALALLATANDLEAFRKTGRQRTSGRIRPVQTDRRGRRWDGPPDRSEVDRFRGSRQRRLSDPCERRARYRQTDPRITC